jgi:hypothetical protein
MPNAASIAAVLAGLRAATDGLRSVIEAQTQLDSAESKLRLADAFIALADARSKLVDIQDALESKDLKIQELWAALRNKADVIKWHDAYYRKTPAGEPIGDAFCLRCWEVDQKLVHLVTTGDHHQCPACSSAYDSRLTRSLTPEGRHATTRGGICPKCGESTFMLQTTRTNPILAEQGPRRDRFRCSICSYEDERSRDPGD